MTYTDVPSEQVMEKASNLRAIFEILAYLHVDARKDGYGELADRLEFAMSHAEQQLGHLKKSQMNIPASSPTIPA